MKNWEKQIVQIKNIILEMAKGNFNYRIPRSDQNNDTEAIVVLLNMLAQELQASYNPFIYNAPATKLLTVNHYLFLISPNSEILTTNFDQYPTDVVRNQNFTKLLTTHSQEIFNRQLQTLRKKDKPSCSCKLQIITETGLLMPLDCTLFRLQYDAVTGNFLLVASRIQSLNPVIKKELILPTDYPVRKLEVLKNTADIQTIQKVEAYLREHTHAPISSLKTLGLRFGINEFKLKKGFKELYQTTVFRYHIKQRLHLAKQLIATTGEQLSGIALKTGFKSYPHFGEAFKKEFGVAPSFFKKNQN